MNARRSLAISVALALTVVGCASPPPPPQTPSSSTPRIPALLAATPKPSDPAATYRLAPPTEIQDWLSTTVRIGFRPLTATELQSVVVGPDAAEAKALAEPGSGYGPGHDHFVWTKVGCIFLGYYVAMPMPRVGYVAPEFPAYLVQVLAKQVKDFPGENVEIEVIDARTGERSFGFGYGPTPVLGTTCGKKP